MTDTRQRVLDYVVEHIHKQHYAPVLSEIAAAVGVSRSDANYHVNQLIEEGRLRAVQNGQCRRPRGLTIGGEDEHRL